MADTKSIRVELDELEEAVIELQTLSKVCLDLAGPSEGAPQWPTLVTWHSDRLARASEALAKTLRQNVLPIIEDMPRLSRAANPG